MTGLLLLLPFLHLSSFSAPLPSLSLSGSACRSGYLIHVQRHCFLIPRHTVRGKTCHTLVLDCILLSPTRPLSLHPPSESVRYGGTLQTLPSGPTDNPPTKPQPRNTGGLDIFQPRGIMRTKAEYMAFFLFLPTPPSPPPPPPVLLCSSCSVSFTY